MTWPSRGGSTALVIALLLAGCADDEGRDGDAARPSGSAAGAPQLVEGECAPPIPTSDGFRCGTVTVPMRRGDPSSPWVDLAVAVLPAPEPGRHDDPVVVIDRLEASIAGYDGFAALPERVERDVVLFDMRGTGLSAPSLDCAEVDYLSPFTEAEPSRREPYLDAVTACRERLEGEGIDLSAYTLHAVAADVVDIRTALGYERWNVLGLGREDSNTGMESTDVVLELMRIDGDAIRSVTLDAPTPPQLDPWTTELETTAAAVDAVAAACADQPPCQAAHPDWKAGLAELLRAPRTEVEATSGAGDPMNVTFDPAWWSQYLSAGIGSLSYLPEIPRLTATPLEDLAKLIAASTAPKSADSQPVEGFLLSALCPQTGAATTLEERSSATEIGLEAWGTYVQADSCARWSAAAGDRSLDEPVTSDIPTLLLVGQFNPHANLAGARLLASTLTNAHAYEIPAATAGLLGTSECARTLRSSFVAQPDRAPDTSCLAEIPALRLTP